MIQIFIAAFPNLMRSNSLTLIVICLATVLHAQKPVYQGQGPNRAVTTTNKPVVPQWKGVFALDDESIFFSNDFQGGRLNGITQTGEDTFTLIINPENEPINPSPWYAFKIWSATSRDIKLYYTYQNAKSRYFPKLSTDGQSWSSLDSADYTEFEKGTADFGAGSLPENIEITLSISPDTLWVAAQELQTTHQVYAWMDQLADQKDISTQSIGLSKEGRDMRLMTLGKATSKDRVMIISRQHPPEVTGFLAMKGFVETIAGDSKLAKKFRKQFAVDAVPLMNPDGADNGHWRHNSGGIDLNRDWADFNQPETSSIRDYATAKVENDGASFLFFIDFHSTWDDIYYTIDSTLLEDNQMILYDWVAQMDERIPDYTPNVRPSTKIEPTTVSRNYFFKAFDAPGLVFEFGDNTDREFLRHKGETAAIALMELLLDR
jgi:murein tripeptide amidase MpaA